MGEAGVVWLAAAMSSAIAWGSAGKEPPPPARGKVSDRPGRSLERREDKPSILFSGRGWVHVSKLGGVRANPGAQVYDRPEPGAKVLQRFEYDEAKLPEIIVLGCRGSWVRIRAGSLTGWTQAICNNERTTCM
jgi:hypothetical protein